MISNWGWGGMEFLMVVLSQSTGLEDGSRPLQTSERPLLGWEMVIFRGAEKFGTWPLLTPNLTSKAQYARVRTPKLIPSTHPLTGHGFGSLQTSKRPLLGWEMVIFRGAEKFGTWPWMTLCARMHTYTHPKHMPSLWACVWAFTDLKKTYPGLRTKNLKLQKFLVLFRHFSMEYNIAQLVWKSQII